MNCGSTSVQHAPTQPDHTRTQVAASDEFPTLVRRTSFFERKPVRQALSWVVIAGMLLFWGRLVPVFSVPVFVLRGPSGIFAELWHWHVPILKNSWQTLMATLVGFAFPIVIGAIGGVAL